MAENCRVTVTFTTEFESDDPEVDLAQLAEEAEFEPRDFIKTCYDQGYHTSHDVHTERNL